jgi:hypothetical protein
MITREILCQVLTSFLHHGIHVAEHGESGTNAGITGKMVSGKRLGNFLSGIGNPPSRGTLITGGLSLNDTPIIN